MQERRRMLSYIEQEDIPSSATEITSDNYGTVYGNVCYIPLNGQYDVNGAGASATNMEFQSQNNQQSLHIISLNDIPVYNISSNNTYISAHMPTKFDINYIEYTPLEFNVNSYWYGFPFGNNDRYTYRMPFIYPEDTILYVKVKFDRNVTVSFHFDYMISWFQPIYIDNE